MTAAPSLWGFGPEDAPVTVRNAEALLAHLPVFLAGWPLRRIGDGGSARPDIDVIEPAGGGFTIRVGGPGGSETVCSDEFEAANALADGLIAGFVAREPNRICLRAGAVALGDGLAIMLGAPLAGKTSVSLQMTAAGRRLFGDDRLAIEAPGDDGAAARGLCLGLMPALRLPLPADCGARFAEFVDSYTEIRDDEAAYLKLWEAETAGFGDAAPLAALVILDRREEGPARIEPEASAAMVTALLENSFAPHIEAACLAEQLGAIVRRCACYRVTFASSREAAEAIAGLLKQGAKV